MSLFTYIDREEAAWLLDKRKNNNVRLYVMSQSNTVIVSHDVVLNHSEFESLLNSASRFVHYHYNDNPDCGRQVVIKLVTINEFGFDSGIKVTYEVQIEKIIPSCNLDNKDLQD